MLLFLHGRRRNSNGLVAPPPRPPAAGGRAVPTALAAGAKALGRAIVEGGGGEDFKRDCKGLGMRHPSTHKKVLSHRRRLGVYCVLSGEHWVILTGRPSFIDLRRRRHSRAGDRICPPPAGMTTMVSFPRKQESSRRL